MKPNPAACALALLIPLAAGCASGPAPSSGRVDLARMMALHQDIPDVALEGPLGSRGNPIRANGAHGQRDYLARLRCGDGRAPRFDRIGSIGIGPYGKMLDDYRVQCEGAPQRIVTMDLYHCVEETRAIDGFEIVARVVPIPRFGSCRGDAH